MQCDRMHTGWQQRPGMPDRMTAAAVCICHMKSVDDKRSDDVRLLAHISHFITAPQASTKCSKS